MRTVYTSGGYSDALELDVAGADLTGATFRAALVLEGDDTGTPPAADAAVWRNVTVESGGLGAALKLAVLPVQPPGHYHVWTQVTVGGITVPVRVADAETGRPWLVKVV